jgi:hypothetical protein
MGIPNWSFETSRLFIAPLPGLKNKKLPRQPRAIKTFSGTVAREKEDFYKGSLSLPISLLCYCFA